MKLTDSVYKEVSTWLILRVTSGQDSDPLQSCSYPHTLFHKSPF